MCFYEHTNFGGTSLIGVPAHGWVDNVGSFANDKISSYREHLSTSPPCRWHQ
ncbi:peptidase inhibitor family I36 protein [Streptosporangium carneum]|uniref:peptidase inhibitor family I36 protein n=1 Tax=Streptosporangium carneum TaxID=47481 RepID=UPI003CD065F4